MRIARAVSIAGFAALAACAAAAPGFAQAAKPPADTTKRIVDREGIPPAGFGTLRQDQIAIRIQTNGLTISAIPLEESIIRTLAPDSYRTLHNIRESKKAALEALRARSGMANVEPWYVWFTNVQQGDARFDAFDFIIRSVGQDFRPLDALALTPGFGDGRVAQRATQAAVYAFDPQRDLNQPLTVTALGQQTTVWGDTMLPLIERERSLIWSRSAAGKP